MFLLFRSSSKQMIFLVLFVAFVVRQFFFFTTKDTKSTKAIL
jgi:hypothetical protein